MKNPSLILICTCLLTLAACGQTPSKAPAKNTTVMDTLKLSNETVRKAIDAWQKGDAKLFQSFFTSDAKLFDDGNPRDFQRFIKDACGHEKFSTIDKVENNGFDVYGNFHTESWGDFKTYFKFHLNAEGKFDRLDIGQAKY